MSDWRPIAEANHDGSDQVVWREGWKIPFVLCWKYNPRIDKSYWGDPDEMDDYNLANGDGPTHYLHIMPPHESKPTEPR